ncbi:MAG: hypothetical protein ACREBE_28065, partial [bacterium]
SIGFIYRDQRRRLDIGYRYREDQLEQTDLIFFTPLVQRWSLAEEEHVPAEQERLLEVAKQPGFFRLCHGSMLARYSLPC